MIVVFGCGGGVLNDGLEEIGDGGNGGGVNVGGDILGEIKG